LTISTKHEKTAELLDIERKTRRKSDLLNNEHLTREKPKSLNNEHQTRQENSCHLEDKERPVSVGDKDVNQSTCGTQVFHHLLFGRVLGSADGGAIGPTPSPDSIIPVGTARRCRVSQGQWVVLCC